MGNLSFGGQGEGWKKLTGWLSLSTDPFKSRHAQLSATGVIPGCERDERTRNLEISRCAIAHLRSGRSDHPGMTINVSTNPLLDPLAMESLCPCGNAR